MGNKVFGSEDVGCWIDQSSGGVEKLNRRIIEFAEAEGFIPGAFEDADSEELNDLSDEAVDYLNDNCVTDSVYFTIEDNSLYLVEADEDEGEDEDEDENEDEDEGDWD